GKNFEIQNGSLEFVGSSGDGSTAEIRVGGNWIQSGGLVTKNTGGTSACNLVFNGSSTQTFTKSGGTISNAINFIINSGATVDFGSNILDGSSGTFTLSSGGGIRIGSTAGITASGPTGNIQNTGTRTFSTGANYTYTGSAAQVTG